MGRETSEAERWGQGVGTASLWMVQYQSKVLETQFIPYEFFPYGVTVRSQGRSCFAFPHSLSVHALRGFHHQGFAMRAS